MNTRPFVDAKGKPKLHKQMVKYLRKGFVPLAPQGLKRKDREARRFSSMMRRLYSMARGYMMRDFQNRIMDELRLHHWRCGGSRYSAHLEQVQMRSTMGNPLRNYYVVGAACYLATVADSRSRRRRMRQATIMNLQAKSSQFRNDLALVRKIHKEKLIDKLDHRDPATFHPCEFHEHKRGENCHLIQTFTRAELEEDIEESVDSEGESVVYDVPLPMQERKVIDLTGTSERESSFEADADGRIDGTSGCEDMDLDTPEMTFSLPSSEAHQSEASPRSELAISPKTPHRYIGEVFRARAPSAESVIRREMGYHIGERVFAWVDDVRQQDTGHNSDNTLVKNSGASIYQSPASIHPRAREKPSEGASSARLQETKLRRASFTYDKFKSVMASSPAPPSSIRNQSQPSPHIHRAGNLHQKPVQIHQPTPGSSSQMAIKIEDDDDELDSHRYCLEAVHPDRLQYLLRVNRWAEA